jgi:putative ABC transport system permease protein
MSDSVTFLEAALSLTLIVVAVGLSMWRSIGVERSIVWAAFRAAVQLLAVGVILVWILESSIAAVWAWLWVVFMVVVAAETVQRRRPRIPKMRLVAATAIGGATGISLLIVFGLGVFDIQPVTIVVIAGITIGNTMPGTVLAVDRGVGYLEDHAGQVESLLALGFNGRQTTRFLVAETARTALIPQIERTKVVGLIALPGAMTGLLLAGVDPIDAVLVQLVIMYLVLGSVAVAVLVVTTTLASRSLTADLRLASWVGQR